MILSHADIPIAALEEDNDGTIFMSVNAYQATEIVVGLVFGSISHGVWVFKGHNLPKGVEFLTVDMDLVASAARPFASTINIRLFKRDQQWHIEPFRTDAWRVQSFASWSANIRDTGAVLIVDTSPGVSNFGWALKFPFGTQFIDRNFRFSERFTVPAGPTPTLGTVDAELQRVGAPTGVLTLEIMGIAGDGTPDEIVAATSDPVTAATIPAGPSFVTFTFSGGDQIALPPGDYFLTLSSTSAQSPVAFISWRGRSAFFNPSHAYHFGEGVSLDWGNYPGVVDVIVAAINNSQTLPAVTWVVPTTVAGNVYTTPDLAAILTQAVQQPGYETGDPIGISFDGTGSVSLRTWGAFGNALYAPAVLRNITFRKRRVSVI